MFATNAFLAAPTSTRHRSGARAPFAGRRTRTPYRTAPVSNPAPRFLPTTTAQAA